jgi:hypothetical protein
VSVANFPKVVKPETERELAARRAQATTRPHMGDWKPNGEKMTREKQGDLTAGQPQGVGEAVRSQSPHTSCEAA